MPEDTLLLPDASALDAVEAAVAGVGLPPEVEAHLEPARDYPGQELAVDVYAPTEAGLRAAVDRLRVVLADYRPELASVVDSCHRAARRAGRLSLS